MEKESHKTRIPIWAWILGCLALIFVCGLIVAGGSLAAVFLTVERSSSPIAAVTAVAVDPVDEPEPSPEDSREVPSTNTPEASPSATEDTGLEDQDQSGSSDQQAADPYAAERAVIEANVAELRELAPREEVDPTILNKPELRQRLAEEFAEQYTEEEARNDAIAMSAFDFVSPEFDLYNFSLDLLTEEIAGFYDPETDEFVIVSDDQEFGVLEQWTHAHEYVHALQDQYFELELLDDDSLDSEAVFALQALAEGDATLVQTLYLTSGYFGQRELFDLLKESLSIDTAILDSAPPVLAHELEFPYIQGVKFVQSLYNEGGFAAVDQAWQNLPQTTEHILHPERYLAGDEPQIVSLAPLTDTLGSGWQLADQDILGEFYLREYLIQQLDDELAGTAAAGWGGDQYAVYWNEERQELIMALAIAWDTAADAAEFSSAYANYPAQSLGTTGERQANGALCWSGEDVICFYEGFIEDGGQTLIVRAPDIAMAAAVAASLRG